MINASQKVFDLRVLPPIHHSNSERKRVVDSFSFEDYFTKLFIPYQVKYNNRPGMNLHRLNLEASLYSSEKFIINATNIYLIHNEDDFLLRREFDDVGRLKYLFNKRAYFFPRGGHLGNIWHDDFMRIMWSIVAD